VTDVLKGMAEGKLWFQSSMKEVSINSGGHIMLLTSPPGSMPLIRLSAAILSFERGSHANGCMGDAMSLKENRKVLFEPSIKQLFSNGGSREGAYEWGFLFGSKQIRVKGQGSVWL
jgi:hypothetical protein